MTTKPTRIDMNDAELDVLIGDIANRRAPILPILRRVRSGDCGYLEITYAGARILRLGPPGRLPVVTLVADGEGRGPEAFPRAGFIRHLLSRAGAVVIVCDEQDALPYEIAASHAGEGGKHVLLVECRRSSIGEWSEFAYANGVEPNDLVAAFISEPDMADGVYRDVPFEDIPATPRRRLN